MAVPSADGMLYRVFTWQLDPGLSFRECFEDRIRYFVCWHPGNLRCSSALIKRSEPELRRF